MLRHMGYRLLTATRSAGRAPATLVHTSAAANPAVPSSNAFRNTLIVLTGAAAIARAHDDTWAVCASLPRTWLAMKWAMRAGKEYKSLMMQHQDRESSAFLEALSQLHTSCAEGLLAVCRANGGVYVKAGQFAASFGAVPPEYRAQLQLLQDRASPQPFEEVRRVVEEDLGREVGAVFLEFSPEATAAASLAQVHRARLREGGVDVAVKVQYPGLRAAVAADLAALQLLSRAAQVAIPEYHLGWLLREIRQKLEVELDFRLEVANAEWLRGTLLKAGDRTVAAPKMHRPLCGPRLIVMEWVEGVKVNDLPALSAAGINAYRVGLDLLRVFADMVYVQGRVHGDPHPGNILVRSCGGKSWANWLLRGSYQPYQVVLLDHGTYLHLDPALRQQYCHLWSAFVASDMPTARRVATAMAGPRAGHILPVILTRRAATKEEKETLRKEAGLGSLADTTQLLATAPQGLVELLRLTAVVRAACSQLGVGVGDRLLINGDAALRGLARDVGWKYRWWVWGKVQVYCTLLWCKAAAHRALLMAAYVRRGLAAVQ